MHRKQTTYIELTYIPHEWAKKKQTDVSMVEKWAATVKARGTLSPKPSQKLQINIFLSWATIKEAPLHSISKLICVKAKNPNQPQPTHAKTLTNIQPAPVPFAVEIIAIFSVEWLGARLSSWCLLLGLEVSCSSLLPLSGSKEPYFPSSLPTPWLIV